jgi:hypothetical protein
VLAFADAVNAVVKSDGVNGLTRANLITAIKGLTDFDAGGMIGKRSFKDGKITQCFMITQFKSGKWVRQYPTKKGTFDCKASNAITVKGNLITAEPAEWRAVGRRIRFRGSAPDARVSVVHRTTRAQQP